MGILDEIRIEADRAAEHYRDTDPDRSLSEWCTFMISYIGEAFSVRHRNISKTRASLIKLAGLAVNCVRQIDDKNCTPHRF